MASDLSTSRNRTLIPTWFSAVMFSAPLNFPNSVTVNTVNCLTHINTFSAGIFLASVAGISALVGFGTTVASVKKKDSAFFNKGVASTREMTETGAALAMRALGLGTLYAVIGCSVFFYSIWKLAGVNDVSTTQGKVCNMVC
jgi:multisubunit Na+/H+ antiporter MnhF subunit